MRPTRSHNLLHPTVLLALSMTLCGGSLLQAGVPAAAMSGRPAERATELTAGQRETVAQILQCLTEAAKELQKHGGKAITTPTPMTVRVTTPRPSPEPTSDEAPPIAGRVLLHHLNLPPPVAAF